MKQQYSIMVVDTTGEIQNNWKHLPELKIYKLVFEEKRDETLSREISRHHPDIMVVYVIDQNDIDLILQLRQDKDHGDLQIIAVSQDQKWGAAALKAGVDESLEGGFAEHIISRIICRIVERIELSEALKVSSERVSTLLAEVDYLKRSLDDAIKKDPLTGCFNRREMLEHFKYQISQYERNHRPFSIVLCDIDYFKHLNHQYGYHGGDQILQSVGGIIQSMIRKLDFLGRWGGGSFFLILPETEIKGAEVITDRLRERIAATPFHHGEKEILTTVTMGITEYTGTIDINDNLNRAREALYKGKQLGRNRVILHERCQ